jgi:uncharacterized DUF497 family protein
MRITWNPKKRADTLEHRGLDFQDASLLFAGRHATREDSRKDYGEVRYISVGYLRERFVVVVWTMRDDARHIISMRHGHEKEEKHWRSNLA